MSKERILWLDGLKFCAALGILTGHYWCAFYRFCNVKPDLNTFIVMIFNKPLSFAMNGTYFILIFCIMSGYLARQKKINSLKELLITILKRYLRFALSLMTVYLFIYLLSRLFGFYTAEVGDALSNEWLSKYYRTGISLREVIIYAFSLSPAMNGPLWTLKYIFIGTCIVYVYNYFYMKWNPAYINAIAGTMCIAYSLYMIILGEAGLQNRYLFSIACVSGIVLDKIWNATKLSIKWGQFVSTVIMIGILDLVNGRHNFWIGLIAKYVKVPDFMALNTFWFFIYAFGLLICINGTKWLKNLLGSNLLSQISHLSFQVYIFHWPMICSFSMFLYLHLIHKFSYTVTFLLNLVITLAAVIAWAKIYGLTVDKYILNPILRKI